MKSKHTKGVVRFIHNSVDGMSEFYESMDSEKLFIIKHNEANFSETKSNAQLIADAFNVTNETGLTPRELQKSHAELLELLEKVDLDMAIDNAIGSKVYDKNLHLKINNAINNAKPNIDEK